MSSCFRSTVGHPSFRIQTIISVLYSRKDLFLLPIKGGFDGSQTSRQTSPLQPTTFNFIQRNIYWERVLLAETRKTAFANFSVYQPDVLGWGDLKKRRFQKIVISFDLPKVQKNSSLLTRVGLVGKLYLSPLYNSQFFQVPLVFLSL